MKNKYCLPFLLLLSFTSYLAKSQQVDATYLNPQSGSIDTYKYLRIGTPTSYSGGIMHNLSNNGFGNGDDFVIFSYEHRDISIRAGQGHVLLNPDGGGYIGIGVKTPTAPLHIVRDGQSIRFLTGTNTSGYQLDIGVNDDGVNMVNNSSARGFKFGNSTGTLLTIEEDGDLVMNKGGITVDAKQVGIRNATPKTDLVVGNNFGASISGSSGGRGVFGSNLAVYGYYAGSNNNQLYTPYQHNSGYGYSGMAASWGRLDFYTNGGNTVEGQIITEAPRMTITKTGNVGIGTTTPDAKLTVKGDIHTQEVKVDLNGAVAPPDYVFEQDYPLMSLSEIEKYIQANKHLPEIPSAKEMEQNGVKLLEMNMLLLKKVEELTLHAIDQQKEIDTLRKMVQQLNESNETKN